MLQVDSLIIVVGANLLGLLVALLSIMLIIAVRQTLDARAAVRVLVNKIQERGAEREQQLRALLTQKYGYSGGEVAEATAALIASENRLYERLIALFIGRNKKDLATVDEPLEALLNAYRGLMPRRENTEAKADPVGPSAAEAEAVAAELQGLKDANEALSEELKGLKDANEALSEELQGLKANNEGLSTELGVTMETMSNVLSEYSLLYEGREQTSQQLARLTPERLMKMLKGDFDLNELAADTAEHKGDGSGKEPYPQSPAGEESDATASPAPTPGAGAAIGADMPEGLSGATSATGAADESLDEMLADTLMPETILPEDMKSAATGQTSGDFDQLEQLLADSLDVEGDGAGKLDGAASAGAPTGENGQSAGDDPEGSAAKGARGDRPAGTAQ